MARTTSGKLRVRERSLIRDRDLVRLEGSPECRCTEWGRTWALSVGAAIFVGAPATAQSNLLVNGSFESPSIGVPNVVIVAGSTGLPGWGVGPTSGIDLVRSLWQPADGAQSISLNWTSASSIAQVVTTEPGMSYLLSFMMAAESPQLVGNLRSMDVLWGSALVGTVTFDPVGHTNSSMGWEHHQFVVTGSGSDELRLQSTTIAMDAYGPAVDAVSVRLAIPADLDADGDVDAADLASLLGNWGQSGLGDLNNNGTVGAEDLAMLLGAWTG